MSLHAVNILGINITNSPKKDILEEIQKYLKNRSSSSGKSLQIVTPNPEQIVYSRRDTRFVEMMNRADIAIPDGIGLVWAGAGEITQTLTGIDFMEELCIVAEKEGVPIALIGGKEKIAVKALECLQLRCRKLSGIALEAPVFEIGPSGLSMSEDMTAYFKKLAETLKKQNIGMVFVGLGSPKQEYFIELLTSYFLHHKSPIVFMSVGGSFDEISGAIPRAPQWVSQVGLKWLWRLLLEPWRIKRQLSLITFVWLVLKDRYRLK